MSVISSGTQNKLRSPNHITHIIQYSHRTLSVWTLKVWELCRHDQDTYPVNNQEWNLDAHIGSHIFFEDLYRSNHITTYVVPFVIGMLLAQDSIVGIIIPSSISLPTSLFTRSVIHHLVTSSLVICLQGLLRCVLPRGPRDTSPAIGVTNPNLEIRQPNKYLRRHL